MTFNSRKFRFNKYWTVKGSEIQLDLGRQTFLFILISCQTTPAWRVS